MSRRPEIIALAQQGLLIELGFTPANTDFMDKGDCRTVKNPDIFFSEDAGGIRQAKVICANCPVRSECFKYGESEEFGIFGGLTPAERRSHKIKAQPQRLPLVDLVAQKSFIEKASVSQVSRRYKVEPRTVQRWRKILKNYDQKEQHETQR
jgi:WhiB family redox-sensing transcriptional regulator